MREQVRVAIVGAGPAGLTAAAALAGRVDGEVRVLEREAVAGGLRVAVAVVRVRVALKAAA